MTNYAVTVEQTDDGDDGLVFCVHDRTQRLYTVEVARDIPELVAQFNLWARRAMFRIEQGERQ